MHLNMTPVACPGGGGGGGGLRVLKHPPPPQLWHNSQISSSVATICADNQELVAGTNNKLTGVYNSLSKQLFLIATWPKQPSLSASYLQERVSEGRGQRFLGAWLKILHAIGLAPPSFKSWTRHWTHSIFVLCKQCLQIQMLLGMLQFLLGEIHYRKNFT